MTKGNRDCGLFFRAFKRGGFLGFVLCAALNLAAQERESARIYHAEGPDFTITLNNEQVVYPAAAAKGEGVTLERSGVVQTGARTSVEMQLIPSGTVIKLAENTSLVYNGVDEAGRFTDLGLLYGRIRVVTGTASVVVRGGGVSARIDTGDMGVDYFLEPNRVSRPVFRLYTFRGNAEVFPFGRAGDFQPLGAGKGESLSLDIAASHTYAEKKPIDRDMVTYWQRNNFWGTPPRAMPDTVISVASPALQASVPSETPVQIVPVNSATEPGLSGLPAGINNRSKNRWLSIGLGLTAAAVGLQAAVYYNPDFFDSDRDRSRDIHSLAYIPLGIGLLTTLAGILYNPPSPAN